MDELWRVLPIVAGAVIAGLSAVVKSLYERRDDRLTSHRQLELASKRTAFVSEWLEVSRSVAGDDAEFAATATTRARAELEEAYEEAQHALANSRSALSRGTRPTLGRQVAWVLMLERRRRVISYVVVVVFYAAVLPFWVVSLSSDPRVVDGKPNEDYTAWWQDAIVAAISTIVLRFVAGALVTWLEGRGSPVSRSRLGEAAITPPGVDDGRSRADHQPERAPSDGSLDG